MDTGAIYRKILFQMTVLLGEIIYIGNLKIRRLGSRMRWSLYALSVTAELVSLPCHCPPHPPNCWSDFGRCLSIKFQRIQEPYQRKNLMSKGSLEFCAFTKMSGTVTISRLDAREYTKLSCVNEESSLWTLPFREANRGAKNQPEASHYCNQQYSLPFSSKESTVAKYM